MSRNKLAINKLTVVLAAALTLAACGRKPATQVAVKVNGDEISVHQVNNALASVKSASPDQAKKAAPQLLESMINEQLLVQKAIEAKLDRDPQVMQAIEASKRQILAQAYVGRALAASPKTSADDIRAFYEKNPALFEQRRIYRLQEIALTAPQDTIESLKSETDKAKNLSEIAGWLRDQNIPFKAASATNAAEQVPMDVLAQLYQMKDGQIAYVTSETGALVIQLLQSQQAPLTEKQAEPAIEQYLLNRKRFEVADAEVKKLRENAKIEYMGDFQATKPQSSPQPRAPRMGEAKPENALDKGLSGLR
jgi:EpsD family peptidyl-prolyl cis-trans isomerase